MKKHLVVALVAGAVLLSGCGKKKKKSEEVAPAPVLRVRIAERVSGPMPAAVANDVDFDVDDMK